MWFCRRRKRLGPPLEIPVEDMGGDCEPELIRIDFDMMVKGSVVMRRGKTIRQFGVTVCGSTRLVTSGDVVDLQTYEALVAAKAVRPPADEVKTEPAPGLAEKRLRVIGDGAED
jgi:hypothetical protein